MAAAAAAGLPAAAGHPAVSRAVGPRRRFRRAGGGQPGARAPAPRATDYLFGGDYWVVALRGDQTVPVAVKTGLTDLEYSEIVSGLEPGDRVLLLPSASLYEQQERLQQFINQRFGSTHAVLATAATAKHSALLPLSAPMPVERRFRLTGLDARG